VTYTNAEARQQVLDALAEAVDQLGLALAYLGEAYELLDENSADRLEDELFRPVQAAYGRAQRTYTEFASRYGLPGRSFEAQSPGLPSQGTRGFIDHAAAAAGDAGQSLANLQDSMLPVDVGDPELRAGIAQVRELIDGTTSRAREFVRTIGR
jgi:hypothetical protein